MSHTTTPRDSVHRERPNRESRIYFLGAAGLAAFVLGVLGFLQRFESLGESRPLLDAVYLSIQLFVLESGSAGQPIPAALQIARFLAPSVTAISAVLAVASLFRERIALYRIRHERGHVVVCGLGDRGIRIVEDLVQHGMRVCVIERDEDEPHIAEARGHGAVVLIGDASHVHTLAATSAHRAAYVIAVCADDGVNAQIAASLAALIESHPQPTPVTAIVHIEDTELRELLSARQLSSIAGGKLAIRFFNVPMSGAAAMLGAVPPIARKPGRAPWIVVIGLGKLGRSLIAQAAERWREDRSAPDGKPRITAIDVKAFEKVDLLRARIPCLDEVCDVVPVQAEKDSAALERGDPLRDGAGEPPDAVYVCPDDDVHALVAALVVKRHTEHAGTPIAVRMGSSQGLAMLMRTAGGFEDLRPVGVLDLTCTIETMLGCDHDER